MREKDGADALFEVHEVCGAGVEGVEDVGAGFGEGEG